MLAKGRWPSHPLRRIGGLALRRVKSAGRTASAGVKHAQGGPSSFGLGLNVVAPLSARTCVCKLRRRAFPRSSAAQCPKSAGFQAMCAGYNRLNCDLLTSCHRSPRAGCRHLWETQLSIPLCPTVRSRSGCLPSCSPNQHARAMVVNSPVG